MMINSTKLNLFNFKTYKIKKLRNSILLIIIFLNIIFLPQIFFCRYLVDPVDPADSAFPVIAFEAEEKPKRIDQLLREDRKKWLEFLKQNEMAESEDCP